MGDRDDRHGCLLRVEAQVNSEPSVFENIRDACAVLARKTAFAQLTVRHKVDSETATAISTELYLELKSLTPEQVKERGKK